MEQQNMQADLERIARVIYGRMWSKAYRFKPIEENVNGFKFVFDVKNLKKYYDYAREGDLWKAPCDSYTDVEMQNAFQRVKNGFVEMVKEDYKRQFNDEVEMFENEDDMIDVLAKR